MNVELGMLGEVVVNDVGDSFIDQSLSNRWENNVEDEDDGKPLQFAWLGGEG